ncbi:hypothetical protein [Cyanothece sp. BG0011]|uniref:hypothetical protein n=1 Tax=Cyanothece sp. BG0011 TaxID=2082950 RepID=UPI000D1D5BBE|nr:hypothetical protein [Cyanothece sp. BG0011]
MFTEIEETTKALCLGKREITFKIEIPHPKSYRILADNQVQVIAGDRYELSLSSPLGGQCSGKAYRLKGTVKGRYVYLSALSRYKEYNNTGFEGEGFQLSGGTLGFGPITNFSYTIDDFFRVVVNWKDGANRSQPPNQKPGSVQSFIDFDFPFPNDEGILNSRLYETTNNEDLASVHNYYSDSFNFSHWERTDGTSLEDDINECGSIEQWNLQIYDCDNNLVFNQVYNKKPFIIEEGEKYQDPIFLTIPLWFITYGAMRKQEIVEDGITKKCAVIWSSQPFSPNSVVNLKVPLLEPPIFGFQFTPKNWTLIDKFCSPSCSNEFPKISYSCDCKSQCPPNTVCSIQKGDQILCLDKNGCVLESINAGCIEPDYIC